MTVAFRCLLVLFALSTFTRGQNEEDSATQPVGIGFCLDQANEGTFKNTLYSGISAYYDKATCENDGYTWCDLRNDTRLLDQGTGAWFYYFSPCCIENSNSFKGLPTCAERTPPELCAYHNWAQKLTNDLLGGTYDLSIAPGTPEAYKNGTYKCVCAADDPNCRMKSLDGKHCVVCESSQPCGEDTVTIGMHFFKVHTIDLRTSELALSIWLRQEWYDSRLKYHSHCYGNIPSIAVQAKSGSLEESRIWTPDVELYNSEKPLWGGFSERLASIYACSPASATELEPWCGYVYWSTPGIMKALCKFKGLAAFPYDKLSCELELAGWATDGMVQDLRLNPSDGGIAWVDDPNKKDTTGGLTAGSSYQDYTIKTITAKRVIQTKSDRPNIPWPTLIYEISFSRSGGWYEMKLVWPMIILTLLSFTTFWISPEMGERLVYGITVVLALLTHDIVVTGMMPICEEMTYLNYLSLVCQGFAAFALFETATVLWIYHQKVSTWSQALVPKPIRQRVLMKRLPNVTRTSVIEKDTLKMKMKRRASYQESRDAQVRDQLFRMMFIEMDRNYTGFVEPEELIFFGSFIMGSRFRHIKDLAFWRNTEAGGDDLHVNFEDFVTFCETKIDLVDDTEYLKMTAENFLKVSEKRNILIQQSWQETANSIDSFSRFGVPFAFFVFLASLNGTSLEHLTSIEASGSSQLALLVVPIWPLLIVFAVCFTMRVLQFQKMSGLKRKVGGEGADVGSGWFRSYSIEQDATHRNDAPVDDKGDDLGEEFSNAAMSSSAKLIDSKPKPNKVGKPKKGGAGSRSANSDLGDLNF